MNRRARRGEIDYNRPAVVYRAFNADDVLLYVGCSVDVATRLRTHQESAGWWDAVARVHQEPQPSLAHALNAERKAIHDEMPRWNVTHRNPNHPDGPAWCTDDIYDVWPGDCARAPHGYVPEWSDDVDSLEYYRNRRDVRLARRAQWHEMRRLLSGEAS